MELMTTTELWAQAREFAAWIGATALGLLLYWVRASRASTSVARDSAERNVLQSALSQRDEALAERDRYQTVAEAAWSYRTEDAAKIARLTAELESCRRDMARMEAEFARQRQTMEQLRRMVRSLAPNMPDEAIGSGHAPLGEN